MYKFIYFLQFVYIYYVLVICNK